MKKRPAIVGALIALIVLFWAMGLHRYLTLEYIQDSRESFARLYSAHPALVIGCYAGVYILVTALSLPGAAVMTLAGGTMFGLATGVLVVSFASTIGATPACLSARFVLRDRIQGRFGERLEAVNRGVEAEGAFYLFTLRLVPAFPFWMINPAMGLTRMRVRTFYLLSQAGMLPGTIVYVNAGRELGKLEGLSGILSPSLVISFVILAVFPLVVKRLLGWYTARRRSGESS